MSERIRCPVCGRPFAIDVDDERAEEKITEQKARGVPFPFCSEKCRLVDLGRWIDEEYRVSESILPKPENEEP